MNLNSVIATAGTLNVRIGKQTTVFDNDTVMLLLEDIFVMFTLPKFEFNMLDFTVMQTIYPLSRLKYLP